jgi:hypothetical protein
MRPNMMSGALCLISAAVFAACQPGPSSSPISEPVAKPAESSNLKAPQHVAKVTAASVAPKKTVATAGANMPNASKAKAEKKDDEPISTTMTGCLVRDDGIFQLKDTDGEHAPKTRSWKSGFIKKSSAAIDLVDTGSRLRLGSHVGYRVSVSGTLTDREMQARTMRATSERCD